MPSTRSPPLKKTLPSMRVVAPIRLSIRFCGLLDLPNMVFASLPQRDGVGRLRLRGAGLVDPPPAVFGLLPPAPLPAGPRRARPPPGNPALAARWASAATGGSGTPPAAPPARP